jgi:DNA-binding transcriptional regulator YiaG
VHQTYRTYEEALGAIAKSHATMNIKPENLRRILLRGGLTQAAAAEVCHVALRTMEQWLQGRSKMPRAATELLIMALVAEDLLQPEEWMREWVRPKFMDLLYFRPL